MPQRRPRWGLRILAIVLSVLLVAIAVVVGTVPRDQIVPMPVGKLTVSSQAQGLHQAGSLMLNLDANQARVGLGRATFWESDPGAAFVVASQGELKWRDYRGYVWLNPSRNKIARGQHIENVVVTDGAIKLSGRVGDLPMQVSFTSDGDSVLMHAQVSGADSISLITGRSRGAGVHGMGEQFQPFDLSGRIIPLVNREQGVGRGTQPLTFLADVTNRGAGANANFTYAAWPSFVTGDLRGVQLIPGQPGTDAIAIADLTRASRVGLEVWHDEFTAQLDFAETPTQLLAQRAQPAPVSRIVSWATHGAIVGLQGGSAAVREKVAALREAGAEITAVWIQDWVGRRTTSFGDRLWWTWQVDKQRYPDWDDLVLELAILGIRTTTYVNPFIVDASEKGDPSIRNLFNEARDAGHLVKDVDGGILLADQGEFSAAMVDLSRPESRAWYAQVIADEVLTDGVEGFMADFAEGPPPHAAPANGSALQTHNAWAGWWAETVQLACQFAYKPDCLTWFRAASSTSMQHAALFWNGDQLVDFGAHDGLASVLTGTFAAGVSGMTLTHSDVGGYTSINAVVKDYVRQPDLLARWGELAAFGVVMRSHEGNRPAQNRQVYDADEVAAFARNSKIFAALAPYREWLIRQAMITGVPVIRHAWLEAPGSAAAKLDTQFFFGPDVFVAPVLKSGVTKVDVTLPPGEWIHLFSGEAFDGDQRINVAAPLGQPAAFVRADSNYRELLVQEFAKLK